MKTSVFVVLLYFTATSCAPHAAFIEPGLRKLVAADESPNDENKPSPRPAGRSIKQMKSFILRHLDRYLGDFFIIGQTMLEIYVVFIEFIEHGKEKKHVALIEHELAEIQNEVDEWMIDLEEVLKPRIVGAISPCNENNDFSRDHLYLKKIDFYPTIAYHGRRVDRSIHLENELEKLLRVWEWAEVPITIYTLVGDILFVKLFKEKHFKDVSTNETEYKFNDIHRKLKYLKQVIRWQLLDSQHYFVPISPFLGSTDLAEESFIRKSRELKSIEAGKRRYLPDEVLPGEHESMDIGEKSYSDEQTAATAETYKNVVAAVERFRSEKKSTGDKEENSLVKLIFTSENRNVSADTERMEPYTKERTKEDDNSFTEHFFTVWRYFDLFHLIIRLVGDALQLIPAPKRMKLFDGVGEQLLELHRELDQLDEDLQQMPVARISEISPLCIEGESVRLKYVRSQSEAVAPEIGAQNPVQLVRHPRNIYNAKTSQDINRKYELFYKYFRRFCAAFTLALDIRAVHISESDKGEREEVEQEVKELFRGVQEKIAKLRSKTRAKSTFLQG